MTASAYRPRERAGDRAFRKASREASDGGNVVERPDLTLGGPQAARALLDAVGSKLIFVSRVADKLEGAE